MPLRCQGDFPFGPRLRLTGAALNPAQQRVTYISLEGAALVNGENEDDILVLEECCFEDFTVFNLRGPD